MNREALQAFFRSGVFIVVVALLLVFNSAPDSAEYVVSVCSLAIGLTLALLVVVVSRIMR